MRTVYSVGEALNLQAEKVDLYAPIRERIAQRDWRAVHMAGDSRASIGAMPKVRLLERVRSRLKAVRASGRVG